MKFLFALSLIFMSSAFGQVKLPPEEIGYFNSTLINELSKLAPVEAFKDINLTLVQSFLEQDPDSKCKRPEEFKDGSLGTKSILEKRLEKAVAATTWSDRRENLICGIEEFVLYDAEQAHFLTRRTLNRARQMTLNISRTEDTNMSEMLNVLILKKAYGIALSSYKSAKELAKGDSTDLFDYAQNGLQFPVEAVLQLLSSTESNQVRVTMLENAMVWLASDYAAMGIFGQRAEVILSLLTAVSTSTKDDSVYRQKVLSDELLVVLESSKSRR